MLKLLKQLDAFAPWGDGDGDGDGDDDSVGEFNFNTFDATVDDDTGAGVAFSSGGHSAIGAAGQVADVTSQFGGSFADYAEEYGSAIAGAVGYLGDAAVTGDFGETGSFLGFDATYDFPGDPGYGTPNESGVPDGSGVAPRPPLVRTQLQPDVPNAGPSLGDLIDIGGPQAGRLPPSGGSIPTGGGIIGAPVTQTAAPFGGGVGPSILDTTIGQAEIDTFEDLISGVTDSPAIGGIRTGPSGLDEFDPFGTGRRPGRNRTVLGAF